MRQSIRLILCCLVLFTGVFAMTTDNRSTAAMPETKAARVLRHIVLYKFKAECTEAQVQEVIDAFAKLPTQIDTIIGFEHGPNVSQEMKSDGLTYGFVVTFRDEAGLATYLKSPAHDAYVAVVKDRREKVVVFDYWAEK